MKTNKHTILAIDDDRRNIFALTAVLRSRGFECITASNMAEAFSKLESNTEIGAILIDMMMPEMDGYEAIPKIKTKKETANLPVIAVTAQAMPGDREKCLAAGADEYVAKPVDINILLTKLSKFLR